MRLTFMHNYAQNNNFGNQGSKNIKGEGKTLKCHTISENPSSCVSDVFFVVYCIQQLFAAAHRATFFTTTTTLKGTFHLIVTNSVSSPLLP